MHPAFEIVASCESPLGTSERLGWEVAPDPSSRGASAVPGRTALLAAGMASAGGRADA